jgi:hypothetical protein
MNKEQHFIYQFYGKKKTVRCVVIGKCRELKQHVTVRPKVANIDFIKANASRSITHQKCIDERNFGNTQQ